ncbi:unnamed protein product [marine sediment metagenome]|uniref:Uncharacterized protein n=1 Tax=marine sediment metagenome TaxID=412755 RepID=X1A4U6_9ZZZZ
MSIDYEGIVSELMQRDPSIIAVAVITGARDIVYSTDNWDISSDISKVSSAWSSMNAQFVMISGVKYSMLQCTIERMVCTNIKGQGHVVGAKDNEHKIIAYVEPEADINGAYMDTARILDKMSSKTPYLDENAQLGASQPVAPVSGGVTIDPQLKSEITAFLDWIKAEDGLSGYLSYYLQQNNANIMSELAKIYSDLRNICQ